MKISQVLESTSLDTPLKTAAILVSCASFSAMLFLSSQLSINMLKSTFQ